VFFLKSPIEGFYHKDLISANNLKRNMLHHSIFLLKKSEYLIDIRLIFNSPTTYDRDIYVFLLLPVLPQSSRKPGRLPMKATDIFCIFQVVPKKAALTPSLPWAIQIYNDIRFPFLFLRSHQSAGIFGILFVKYSVPLFIFLYAQKHNAARWKFNT